ncbi:hypothetical protein BJF77_16010 [Kocuria sp. CNJ-770]|uniref:alpha-amylase family glycosyl hydrolase n=1 Tax=Kocuria sp. CNJ-770 TaxID=1904964 RepID=UPI00095E8E9E|nr:alpha-amylase family glycosyl hydrolase [Kocuria sp. CNJ-770]OLT06071.1 hypothetical protein BJF77_16010 [Kocuria sp. CNJ-770]
MKRRPSTVLAGLLSATAVGAAPVAVGLAAAAPAAAAPPAVTLVGSLQDELGCSADWQPSCAETVLAPVGGGTYEGTFEVPAGTWEYKVALDGGWDESHPAENLPLVLEGPATVVFSFDDATDTVSVRPAAVGGEEVTEQDRALAGDSLRAPVTSEQFYFVMADRFANGDPSNDTGGLEGDRLEHGFDPTDKAFYHGGDLQGIQEKLDYIEGLGTTAIWLTPSFKNRPVQGEEGAESAGYHGYWITDFTQIDPHLGSNEDMQQLVDAAHARGMKVYFDIITNHTADVIDYAEGTTDYVTKAEEPYRDAAGEPFDDARYAGSPEFPATDPATSFPYNPTFRSPEDAGVKVPEWLNDPNLYHNRGDSTWSGESVTYGDFVGLDDLFTERREVVDGMVDIYSAWAEMGIDGFRIDTVKHVNLEFWQEFSPRVLEAARARNEDFFMFGEVYDADPAYLSSFTTDGRLQAVIDFGFQARSLEFAKGGATTSLRDFYAADDHYTDTDSNAYQLPTFTGNHDMGRASWLLFDAGFRDEELRRRVELSNELMFLTRGQPVVYYGDEQGFVGSGGDQLARQDMFATQVPQYLQEPMIAAEPGAADRYGTDHPLYEQIAELSALRAAHPALADGAQLHRYSSDQDGVYAFSRIDADERREYVVVTNNSEQTRTVTVPTSSDNTQFTALYGTDGKDKRKSGKDARLDVEVAPLSTVVYRAGRALDPEQEAPQVRLQAPDLGADGRTELRADVPGRGFAQVSFAVRPAGTQEWTALGTDDNAPYRVFPDTADVADGTLLEYRAVLKDSSGNLSASSAWAVAGAGGAPADGGGTGPVVGEVQQPDTVSVPGTHNTEMGCDADWAPACEQAQLRLDPQDGIWKGTFDLPAGGHSYKVAVDRAWDENYGAGGALAGANIGYDAPGGPVTFYYDPATHWATTDADGPLLTASGTFQDELGCAADRTPDCLRPWLQDPDGDGTHAWSTTLIPAGEYTFRVVEDLGAGAAYGQDGAVDGAEVSLTVPEDGMVATIEYDAATHEIRTRTGAAEQPAAGPDLGTARAAWVGADLLAVPAGTVPAGTDPALLDWSLTWGPDGALALDAETVTGGRSVPVTVAELPAGVVAEHPELAGGTALRVDRRTARQAGEILAGQAVVSATDGTGRIVAATGVTDAR